MQCFLKIAKFPSRSFMSACSMSSYSILYVFLVLFTGKVLGSLSAENSTCSTSIHEILNSTKPAILLADSTPNNVRIQVFPAMSDCIQSCCEWESCQVAVLENTTCYNIHCLNLDECKLVTVGNQNTTESIQTVILRNATDLRQCSDDDAKSCEVGVDNCFLNEECKAIGRGRGGCCECAEQFVRVNGTCTAAAHEVELDEGTTMVFISTTTTTQAPTTTTRYIRRLAISISPTSIQLPEPKTNITALVVPSAQEGEEYTYKWVVVSFPQNQQPGTIEGNNEETLKLSQLSPGNYTFRITVSSSNSFGENIANLTVLPPKRLNQPPVAVIRPSFQSVRLPNNVAILDGLSSTDDTKVISFKWELEKGPISYKFDPNKTSDTLDLKDLVAGNYTIKLTVTDEEGEVNSSFASVEVVKETDYPPEANAGAPVILFLPQNEVTLNGNQSTDDHGITSWEWMLLSDDSKSGNNEPVKAVDMQDTRTPYPKISKLAEGMYRFQLKVADVLGQSSTAQVDVFVRRPLTTEPRVDAGSDAVVTLPINWAFLDGSKSVDDVGIHKWLWTQLQGPNTASLFGSDQSKVNVTGLTKGTYVFQLTAWDDSGANGNDTVVVTVIQKDNEKPKANAGGDHSVSLPLRWITLNGSASTDDLKIVSWLWTRESTSLAAGTIIANTDRTSVLMLTNLVPGKYVFRLTVTDEQGLSDYDQATLIVHSNPRELDVVTMTLKSDPRSFTESELNTIRDQIALLLHQQGSVNININIGDIIVEPKSGFVVLQFFTTVKSDGGWRTLPGTEVAGMLKRKLRNDINLMAYPVLEVDTAICQNNCSGHGFCDQVTRRCICQAFWMENPAKVSNGGEYNCDWSLVYVIIIGVMVLVTLVVAVWSVVHFCRKGTPPFRRCCSKKRRRIHRYSPLADPEIMRMSVKGSNSLLPSDLDSDTDSDVMFEKPKSNGHANGRLVNGESADQIRA